jgi:hypothetical protein
MDLSKTIADLYEERSRLDRVIASLEQLGEDPFAMAAPAHRRGRKFMSPQERREVSERMRKYWAGRKSSDRPQETMVMTAASAA